MNEEQPYGFQKPTKRASAGSRLVELTSLLAELEEQQEISSGDFNALAMMLADAALDADDATLTAAQEGLQRPYGLHAWIENPTPEQLEARGRVRGLIDLLQWTLRRVVPETLLTRLEPNGHAHSFLQAIADRPGLSNQELTEHLRADETEVSRVGRRLLEGG